MSDLTPELVADPTRQLPPHQLWNSYNVYRYDPGTGGWNPVISQGVLVVGALPDLGNRPALIVHGLGGSIRHNQFSPMAQDLLDNGLATLVLGFEYDSQDSIARNGNFFTQALNALTPGPERRTWALIGHSMGGLVIRSAVQAGVLPIAASGNRVITLGTPHFGSPVANAVQSADFFLQSAVVALLNQGGFVNADGNPSQVSLNAQGITDLRTDSAFLGFLNGNINNHAQVVYFTIAGTRRGEFQTANDLLGVHTDDGLVTITSASPPQLNPQGTGLAPSTHTSMTRDGNVFALIRQFLNQ